MDQKKGSNYKWPFFVAFRFGRKCYNRFTSRDLFSSQVYLEFRPFSVLQQTSCGAMPISDDCEEILLTFLLEVVPNPLAPTWVTNPCNAILPISQNVGGKKTLYLGHLTYVRCL
jgi:hypothetical protein